MKAKVKTKEADKNYKPKDSYYTGSQEHKNLKKPKDLQKITRPIASKQRRGRFYKVISTSGKVTRYYEDVEGAFWQLMPNGAGRTEVSPEIAEQIKDSAKHVNNPNNPASSQSTAGESKYQRVSPARASIKGRFNPNFVTGEFKEGDWGPGASKDKTGMIEDREFLRHMEMLDRKQKEEDTRKLSGVKQMAQIHPEPHTAPEGAFPGHDVGKSDYRQDAGSVVGGVVDIASGIKPLARKGKNKIQGLINRSKEKGKDDFDSGPIKVVKMNKAWEEFTKESEDQYNKMVREVVQRALSRGYSYEGAVANMVEHLRKNGVDPQKAAEFISAFTFEWHNSKPQAEVENPSKNVMDTHQTAIQENPKIGTLHNIAPSGNVSNEGWKDYDSKVKDVVQKDMDEGVDEDPIDENYPNSYYQKIWEQLEANIADMERQALARKKRPRQVGESGSERLSRVMSRTPENPQYSREEVLRLANSMRSALGKPQRKMRNPHQLNVENERMKDQMNSLWEETETKPMTEEPKKNVVMKHLYGAPVEDLPDTVSPPPIFYKTIEPTKKKEKS